MPPRSRQSRQPAAQSPRPPQCDAASAPRDGARITPTADGATSPYPPLQVQHGRLLVPVRVVPRAAHELVSLEASEIAIHLVAPPVDGAANDALIALLAVRLHTSRRAVTIARGARARHKLLAIAGLDVREFWRRIAL